MNARGEDKETGPLTALDQLTIDDIKSRLHAQAATTYDIPPELLAVEPREAAVLIPFLRVDDAWQLLFIRRATLEGDRHSGQVAFAGGKREDHDDDLEQTALRESEEELGIDPARVEVLGHISHHHTVSHFQVRPYIGVMDWPCPLVLDPAEVARAFTIPLAWLADSSNYRIEERFFETSGNPWPIVHFDEYDGEILWGATARMTLSLINLLRGY